MNDNWLETIEKPLRNLIQLLRDDGFNTFASCGHLPCPYVQMEWYEDDEVTKLYNLLVENDYHDFVIRAVWDACSPIQRSRWLELEFHVKMDLANEEDFHYFSEVDSSTSFSIN